MVIGDNQSLNPRHRRHRSDVYALESIDDVAGARHPDYLRHVVYWSDVAEQWSAEGLWALVSSAGCSVKEDTLALAVSTGLSVTSRPRRHQP